MSTPDPNEENEGGDEKPDFHPPQIGPDEDGASPAENTNIQRIVELLPPEERAQLFGYIRQETMSHRGWLPTPAFMREYEEVLPGLAERIVAMPEREQGHRHKITQEVIRRDYGLRSTGQWLGIAALILILLFCVFLAALGDTTAAAWVAGVTIVGTVGVFVAGQVSGKTSTTSKDLVEGEGGASE